MNKFVRMLILIFFIGINTTQAYYEDSNYNKNLFNTNSYNFKINANGGFYEDGSIDYKNNKLILPKPIYKGYNFLGYSDDKNGNLINNILVEEINNKEIYAIWDIINYKIDYDLNGGVLNNLKTTYNVLENFIIPNPSKVGYNFIGWTGSNGSSPSLNIAIKKGTTGNLYYVANYEANLYLVDVNSIIDEKIYDLGLNGYTFDIWVNDILVLDDATYWKEYLPYGSKVRIKTNDALGMKTNYDKTFNITGNTTLKPSWSKNYYKVSYYVNDILYKEEDVGYNDKINPPNYTPNPWEVWNGWNNTFTTMPSHDIKVNGYYNEASCYAWAGHPKAQNGSAIMKQVINAAKNDFINVTGPYEETSKDGRLLLVMQTESYNYSTLLSKLKTSMNRYTWWSYAEVRCDNGYATAIYK